jgi:hypothetical protein
MRCLVRAVEECCETRLACRSGTGFNLSVVYRQPEETGPWQQQYLDLLLSPGRENQSAIPNGILERRNAVGKPLPCEQLVELRMMSDDLDAVQLCAAKCEVACR